VPRCNQCWKEFPTLNRHHHSNTDYYFCDGCLKANLWDCPECDRSFYIGLNQGRYPRHYRMTDNGNQIKDWQPKNIMVGAWKFHQPKHKRG